MVVGVAVNELMIGVPLHCALAADACADGGALVGAGIEVGKGV
jgi:hypothetical protein